MPKKKVTPDVADELVENIATEETTETPVPEIEVADAIVDTLPDPVDDDVPLILSADPEPILEETESAYDVAESLDKTPTAEIEASPEPEVPYGEDDAIDDANEIHAETAPTEQAPRPRRSRRVTAELSPEDEARRIFYGLDFNELDRNLSPQERQEWNSVYASYRGRSVISGTVIGIDRHSMNVRDKSTGKQNRQEMYCAIVIPFRVRIIIPESEMWIAGEERPGFVLRNIVGSKIDMVVIHVDREAGFAIASRRMAMNSRRYYFSTQPSMNRAGSRVQCSVLAVGPRRCLVSCHGFDLNLTQRDMRYAAIPDLRDEYHPGDELDCIVKQYNRSEGKLDISVKETEPNPFDGAEIRHPVGSRRHCHISGKYAGGVFCNLPDGAVVMCSYSSHYEDSQFAIGDKVIVIIQRYEDRKSQIYGKIVSKW